MHPPAQINFVKKQLLDNKEPYQSAYQQMMKRADNALKESHHAPENFSVPGYYQDPQGHSNGAASLQKDGFNAYACALAYRLDAGDQYGQKACELLNAWATINKKYSDLDGRLVMAYAGSSLVIAAQLMSGSGLWEEKDGRQFNQWIVNVYQKACNEIRTRSNNWADWGRFGSMLCAVYLDDREDIKENVRLIKSDLFKKIAEDGSMPEEVSRESNGLWYTYFSLVPMTAACWLVYNSTDENLFALENNGTSIKSAIDYLCYYNQHPDEWKWFENPITDSAEKWPGNLLEAMYGIYHDRNYIEFIQSKRPLMYPYHHYAWTFPTLMPISLEGYQ